jgi:hypothetical protein
MSSLTQLKKNFNCESRTSGGNDLDKLSKSYVKKSSDDLGTMLYSFLNQIKYKNIFLLFIIYILFNTEIFYSTVLSSVSKGAYNPELNTLTEKGTTIVGICIVVVYALIDILISNGII